MRVIEKPRSQDPRETTPRRYAGTMFGIPPPPRPLTPPPPGMLGISGFPDPGLAGLLGFGLPGLLGFGLPGLLGFGLPGLLGFGGFPGFEAVGLHLPSQLLFRAKTGLPESPCEER